MNSSQALTPTSRGQILWTLSVLIVVVLSAALDMIDGSLVLDTLLSLNITHLPGLVFLLFLWPLLLSALTSEHRCTQGLVLGPLSSLFTLTTFVESSWVHQLAVDPELHLWP